MAGTAGSVGCARSKDEVEPPSTNGGGPTSGQVWASAYPLWGMILDYSIEGKITIIHSSSRLKQFQLQGFYHTIRGVMMPHEPFEEFCNQAATPPSVLL